MPATHPPDPRQEEAPDLIVRGGIVLTMAEGRAPIREGTVRIRQGRILSVDDRAEADPGVEILDARDAVVLPGLVNTHGHTAMTLFRGYADDLPLDEWLFNRIFPAEARFLDPETVYWGTLLGCLEMIASGTTCVADGYFFQDAGLEAVERAGLRALIAQGVIDFPAPGVPRPEDNLAVGRAFMERWHGFSERITPGLFCHSPSTCSESTMRDASAVSREFGSPLQTHLSETGGEVEEIVKRTGERPVLYLDRIGVLTPDLIAAHAVHVEAEEISLLAERRVRIAHVPESNMKLASGTAPIHKFLKAGIRVGLGTDGCASNNNLDLIQEMDTAAKLSKVFDKDPTHVSAEAALRMATSGGAAVMGLEREIGTLEAGKRADLIVIDLDRPHLQPLYNPVSTIVYSATGADVRHTVVDGEVLMRDRRFTGIDPEEIMARVEAIARTIGQG
ncbi:MAG: amidohydrolase [Deltaproteobacteria bacterium]|nr:amidohydrolase [Deltaproteobacteria bacterium]